MGSDSVGELLLRDEPLASSRITYVECLAAIARAGREGRATEGREASANQDFQLRWANLVVVEVDEVIAFRAGGLVQDFPLRGAEAIHLASAQTFVRDAEPVVFACWNRRLWEAARELGFEVVLAS